MALWNLAHGIKGRVFLLRICHYVGSKQEGRATADLKKLPPDILNPTHIGKVPTISDDTIDATVK